MWAIDQGKILAGGRESERIYLRNDQGILVVFLGFDGRIENGVERFEYRDGNVVIEFVASRVDIETGKASSTYTVWLGAALNTASRAQPTVASFDVDDARRVSSDIKGALLAWRYNRPLADALDCSEVAHSVRFVMKSWKHWEPSLERQWP